MRRLEEIKQRYLNGVALTDQEGWYLITEVARLREGSEYWGMNQELTEQIAALRQALKRAHNCATLKDDGTCLGCFVSEALATNGEE